MSEEPERVVDPPEATPEDTHDPEQDSSGLQWVLANQQATVTAPSEATYVLSPGMTLQLTPEDAEFIVKQGYATRTDQPTSEA